MSRKKSNKSLVVYSARIDKEVYTLIKIIARAEAISINTVFRRALKREVLFYRDKIIKVNVEDIKTKAAGPDSNSEAK